MTFISFLCVLLCPPAVPVSPSAVRGFIRRVSFVAERLRFHSALGVPYRERRDRTPAHGKRVLTPR